MKQQNKQPTLLGHICYPFFTHIIKKSIWGSYILGINLIKVEALVYLIGAVLGRSLRNKLPMLVKLLFVPGTEESQIDRVTALCRKDAGKNHKEFKEWCDDKPLRFDDFLFYRRIESLLGNANIHMSPRDAYVDYLNGDKKLKKIFEQKVDAKRDPEKSVGESLLILLLQGIFFGSSFPEVTQTMYQKAWENDRRFWTRLWPNDLVMPEDLKEANLDEAEILIALIVADYVSKYYPELIDGLGLMSVIQRAESTGHDFQPSKYEILNEILAREGANLVRKSIKHPELLGNKNASVHIDPINPSDSEYLTEAFLGGPSHLMHFDPEKLENILKKLLSDEYEKYYETARQDIMSGRTSQSSRRLGQE